MKVVISGGGTGGHIYPAIAIANKIKEMNPHAQILFIGTKQGLESEIVPKAGYDIHFIPVSYLKRKLSVHNVRSAGLLMKGLFQARRKLKEYRPDIVIGTGGFVCGPVLYMAAKLGYKTLIHEQNVFPGLTNRILSKHMDCIALSFEEAKKYFKQYRKVVVTGNPIRGDFMTISAEEAAQKYKKQKPIVLVVGGSGGSRKLNGAILELLKAHPENQFEIIWATGKNHYSGVKEQLKAYPAIEAHNRVVPYINDMPYGLQAADLMICSAGAITIAEITGAGKASILIPKAHTAENHQEYNARALAEKGAALMVKEDELSGEVLFKKINHILGQPGALKEMKRASKAEAKLKAVDSIYEEIQQLVK